MSESIEVSVERFVAHTRVLARKYESERRELRLLVRFADEHDLPELAALTPALIEEFLSSRPRRRPRSFNHLRGVVAGLLDWAVRYEVIEATPLRTRPRRSGGPRRSGSPRRSCGRRGRRNLRECRPHFPEPSRAASNGFRCWQTRAVISPVSTSPEPPVAMPGLPVALIACRAPSVTSVRWPFRTTTIPHRAAN